MLLLSRQKPIFFISIILSLIVLVIFFRSSGSRSQTTPPLSQRLRNTKIIFEDLDSRISKPVRPKEPIYKDLQMTSKATTLAFNSLEHEKTNLTHPYPEEFTIVILTHAKRILDMPKVLLHLSGLPRLNRVLIIWNGEKPSWEMGMDWPEVEFSYQVLNNGRNSLNNRFLPLEIIKTHAVLSMDDDMYPSHENILFAFRVWQEFRDRIVGFPGRGVSWNGRLWEYVPHPCEVSLVLTGLAFFHKKYLNLYTYEMPSIIRERVDNITNCEDIAMNFLVSHVTQKAPIKVTPKNEWVCTKCDAEEKGKDSLWKDPKHFDERNDCINFFSHIYGYIPLFRSEYRLDDISENNEHKTCASRVMNNNHMLAAGYLLISSHLTVFSFYVLVSLYSDVQKNL